MATIRQKKALEKMLENGGIISKAMRDSGYSAKTAKTPKKLTNSKGWEKLVEKSFSDSMLLEIHRNLLNLSDNKDLRVVLEALKLAYKIKDKYPNKGKEKILLMTKYEKFEEYMNLPDEELDKVSIS